MLLFLLLPGAISTYAQQNLSGKPGLIYTPTARETPDGSFTLGYTYNPVRYGLRRNGKNPEQILYANLTLIPRLSLGVELLQLLSTEEYPVKEALGDRQLDLSYLVLKEKAKRPSLALILSSPFTVDAAMVTYALVASKNVSLSEKIQAELSAGMGSPYYVFRDESVNKRLNFLANYKLQKKSEDRYQNNYLAGPFGGVRVSYQHKGGLLAEWDSQKINMGGYVTLFRKWTIQAAVLNFDQLSFGSSYTLSLQALPKQLRKQNAAE
ncbi:exopolysaccharide biosynthesis protein YbjH [Pontibacter ummariensis]|uniref:Exopolysaccharide biosynthesis protein YbjH n=1 Tax=Pontibacter ummariensis TaxID=1610492 RepID=A0A239L9Z6_9BACT|nr:YjbH domain-containing protein [Pontibacter ummariensis]PRY03980.1 exopolysaccharide biosynthesis protein YbjH [Pontibacter ummariensis]SNT26354.1 Exopolysaccharide biosynthesis protein YbjH [Pontibacter ummariensis]